MAPAFYHIKKLYPFLIERIAMMDLFLLPNFDCSSFKASLLRKFAVLEIVRMDDIVERF